MNFLNYGVKERYLCIIKGNKYSTGLVALPKCPTDVDDCESLSTIIPCDLSSAILFKLAHSCLNTFNLMQ